MLRRVGFYEELSYGYKECGLLRDIIGEDSDPDEDKIISYLICADCYIVSPGIIRDILSPLNEIIGSGPYLYTDGIWEWPNDLSYYIKKYHAKIPEDFRLHMKENNWKPPHLSQKDIIKLCDEKGFSK